MPRTLSAELTAEMNIPDAGSTPYVKVKINGVDYFPKLEILEHHEESYRDYAILVFNNSDRAFDVLDLRGFQVSIRETAQVANHEHEPSTLYGRECSTEF